METKPKNRAWVKDAAIVFLVVLLLLTFFSNTIMNHSLPEVATQMVTDGTITAKVRGTGTVAANGSHKVKAKANETIGRVMVKAGQEVSAGDVLFVLGPGDSDQLEEAKAALDDLQTQYAQAALSVPLANQCLSEKYAMEQAGRNVETLQKAYDAAEKENQNNADKLAEANSKAKELIEQKNKIETELSQTTQKLDEKKLPLKSLEQAMNAAKDDYSKKNALWQQQKPLPTPTPTPTPTSTPTPSETPPTESGDPAASAEIEQQVAAENVNEIELKKPVISSTVSVLARPFAAVGESLEDTKTETVTEEDVTNAYNKWKQLEKEYLALEASSASDINDLQYKVDTLTLKIKAIDAQLATLGADAQKLTEKFEELQRAKEDYEIKKQAYYDAIQTSNRSIASASAGLGSISNKIKRQQEKIKQLTGEGDENTVTANVSGTVTEVNCTAGDAVLKDDILCAIEVPDMGYTVSFSVTNDQAKRLHVGDTATISNYYWGNQIVATLSTIQTDKKNPMSNKLLTFDLDGDVTSGSEITVSVGQKSARYDLIIPNSAIRTDSNGSFVLAVMAKSSPLGNRYVAKRVAIEVLAADDTNSAVTADLSNGDYVITTSSAPIANGDMVRMADAQS